MRPFTEVLAQTFLGLLLRKPAPIAEIIRGFVDPGDPETLVCLGCGTKLRLDVPNWIQKQFSLRPLEEVEFEEGDHQAGTRDRLVFRNGAEVLIDEIDIGITATILKLRVKEIPADPPRPSSTVMATPELELVEV